MITRRNRKDEQVLFSNYGFVPLSSVQYQEQQACADGVVAFREVAVIMNMCGREHLRQCQLVGCN